MKVDRRAAAELERLLLVQSSVVTTGQAVGVIGRPGVRAHLAAGRWRRVCWGILAAHNGVLTGDQQRWVAVLAAGRDAVLAGSSALSASGVRGLPIERLDVLVPAPRNRSLRLPVMPADMPAVRIIRTRMLPPEHVTAGRPPRTTVARAAVDAASWAANAGAAQAVLATACQQNRVTPEQIFEVLAVRRGVPRLPMIRATMADIAGGAQALSEIDFLKLCRRFRLPAPDQQVHRSDAAGRRRFLDAYWRRWRLHVEVDGAHHMDARQWAADMVRQNDVWIRGDRILRFPANLIRVRPVQVAGQLATALEAGGWQP